MFFQQTPATSFTVSINNNAGTGTMVHETHNAPTALTANTFTRTGFTFAGWNTAANGSGTPYADSAVYPFTASTTLFAQWIANASFTVSFNNNSGTAPICTPAPKAPPTPTANS